MNAPVYVLKHFAGTFRRAQSLKLGGVTDCFRIHSLHYFVVTLLCHYVIVKIFIHDKKCLIQIPYSFAWYLKKMILVNENNNK